MKAISKVSAQGDDISPSKKALTLKFLVNIYFKNF